MLRAALRRLGLRNRSTGEVTLPAEGLARGRLLYSYLPQSLTWSERDPRLQGHSNLWESREISRLFRSEGYEVVAVSWADSAVAPAGEFDAVFDIHANLSRFAGVFPAARKLLHLTGSYGPYQNAAERERLENLLERRGVRLAPRRQITDLDRAEASLHAADAATLLGNTVTLETYPQYYRPKITLIPVSASESVLKPPGELVPPEREFLWFFGGGAVHKGLDLVLEVFAANPDLTLNVVGGIEAERDFFELYRRELTESPNIHLHGHLNPAGVEFGEIVSRCFCFIAPSCSESASTAVATCLQVGLYPIISRQTGIDLPPARGQYLEECTIEEISRVAREIVSRDSDRLRGDITVIQKEARERYSREPFSREMRAYIRKQLEMVR